MFNIVLVAPEIPPNTGNVIRLAANTGCSLHLVEPLGFSMDDKLLRRAGLDYHEHANVRRLASLRWQPGDWLLFGSETAGLPASLRERFPPHQRVRLPMQAGQRSLNLSNAVAVVVFDAWRQNGYAGGA
jgi:tRNA (cytidine/uridine-2'-O-)-methyltransferase